MKQKQLGQIFFVPASKTSAWLDVDSPIQAKISYHTSDHTLPVQRNHPQSEFISLLLRDLGGGYNI